MPFDGEYASYKPLGRILENPRVKELLSRYAMREPSSTREALLPLKFTDVRPSIYQPSHIMAVDGCHAETPLRRGFPGAEASYITVASVLIDLETVRELDAHRPADPKAFRETEQPSAIDCALPGANVIIAGEPSANASFRRAVFDVFSHEAMDPDIESFLETYEALMAYKPINKRQECPYDDCPTDSAGNRGEYKPACGTFSCSCPLARSYYATDALRFHERMAPAGTNGMIFAEVMQVMERVWVIHVLRTLERKSWLSSMRRIAIIIDGPLAVFGQPAWLSKAIAKELARINLEVRHATGGLDLLMIGIEKTGEFVDHFETIDKNDHGTPDQFPKQSAHLISDAYIKKNIIFSESAKAYGADTYFGRKFFYKTKSGARLVASIPYLNPGDDDVSRADAGQYPRLADAMGVLDQIVSSRYPNAVGPLVSAHAEASIPLHLGTRVLEQLAKELIREEAA